MEMVNISQKCQLCQQYPQVSEVFTTLILFQTTFRHKKNDLVFHYEHLPIDPIPIIHCNIPWHAGFKPQQLFLFSS